MRNILASSDFMDIEEQLLLPDDRCLYFYNVNTSYITNITQLSNKINF